MPNWCENDVTFRFPNEEFRDLLLIAVQKNEIFTTFAPLNLGTDERGLPNWKLSVAIEIWGTKTEPHDVIISEVTDLTVSLKFDTPWAPPIGVYEKMNKNYDIKVTGNFREPGEEVFGTCIYDGEVEKNKYYNYPRNKRQLYEVRDTIDPALDDYMETEWERLENHWAARNSDDD